MITNDVTGEPNILLAQLETFSSATVEYLFNQDNWVPVTGITADNYSSYITSRIVKTMRRGIYMIIKCNKLNEVEYIYAGSADRCACSRITKFFRYLFNKTTPGDFHKRGNTKIKHAKLYADRFGFENIENLFICFYEYPTLIPYKGEHWTRFVEGCVIKSAKSKYPYALANKIERPTTANMSISKKRSRDLGYTELPFE